MEFDGFVVNMDGVRAAGSVASVLSASGMNVNALRPYIAEEDGLPYVSMPDPKNNGKTVDQEHEANQNDSCSVREGLRNTGDLRRDGVQMVRQCHALIPGAVGEKASVVIDGLVEDRTGEKNRRRLPRRATNFENDSCKNTAQGIRQDNRANRLPLGRPHVPTRFPEGNGHRA